MTVKELIEKLKELPQDIDVVIYDSEYDFVEINSVELQNNEARIM